METWRAIDGFDGYEVSDQGRLRSWLFGGFAAGRLRAEPKLLRPYADKYGYVHASLRANGATHSVVVHRLVAAAFLGQPDDNRMEVAHDDGNASNNRLSNIRWTTCSDNNLDKRRHGTMTRGEQSHFSKLTDADVLWVREWRGAGWPQHRLAKAVGVTQQTIGRILARKTWAHV